MLKNSNTAKEIGYIFLWLTGIILFYALVHTFLLEPSSGKQAHTKYTQLTSDEITSTAHKAETKVQHVQTVISVAKDETKHVVAVPTPVTLVKKISAPLKTEVKVKNIPVIHVKKEVPTSTQASSTITEVALPIEVVKVSTKPSKLVEVPKADVPKIDIPKVEKAMTDVKLPTLPSVPTVPTVSTPVSIPVSVIQVPQQVDEKVEKKIETEKIIEEVKEKFMLEINSTYNREKSMKLLETARQHIIEKAEAAREAATKALIN